MSCHVPPPAPGEVRRVKLTLLGEAAVGKSSLVLRFIKNAFNDHLESTIGALFLTDMIQTNSGEQIKLEVWDTAGQERFECLAPMYYRNAHVALVVCDISSAKSFERAKRWVAEVHAQGKSNVVIGLAANKADLPEEKRQVFQADVQNFVEENGLLYMETSAKTGHNVHEIFHQLAKLVPCETPEATVQTTRVVEDCSRAKRTCCLVS